jgi:CheY-specific phosphatase CheX
MHLMDKDIDSFFGKHLFRRGLITDTVLEKAVKFQSVANKKIGEIAVEKRYLTHLQSNELYLEQKITNKYFGEIAIDKGYLTKEQVDELLKLQSKDHIFIGEIFVALGYLDEDVMHKELEIFLQKDKERKIIAERKINECNIEFLRLFIECSKNTIYRMLHIPLKLSRKIDNSTEIKSKGILIKIKITGKINKYLVYNFDKDFIDDILLRFFTGFPRKKVLNMKASAVSELVNITCGVIVTELDEKHNIFVDIEPPENVDESILQIPDIVFLKLPFFSPEGAFDLYISR